MTRCPVCGELTNRMDRGLCHACAHDLAPRTGGFCPTCGQISGDDDAPISPCGECRLTPPLWDSFYFHNIYAGTLRDLILGYKFSDGLGCARLLADMAYTSYIDRSPTMPDGIIPVPLHKKRLIWRGYNQSTELCRVLADKQELPILSDGLTRVRNTVPQTRLDMTARQENIKKAFKADAHQIKGKRILLVDDVCTTGATIQECAKVITQAGASGVDVLVLAKTIE